MDLKRKLAAIIVADIVGYSKLIAADEEATLRRLEVFRHMWRECAERYGGRVFNTAGDAVLAEFPSAVEAVRCALDFQARSETHNQTLVPDRQMHFRIGITIGDVVQREGDLLGDGVNIAARLQSLAEGGGICVSSWVRESVANKLEVHFADLGEQVVKNIPEPIRAYAVMSADDANAHLAAADTARREGRSAARWRWVAVVVVLLAAGAAAAFYFGPLEGWTEAMLRVPRSEPPKTDTADPEPASPTPPGSGEIRKEAQTVPEPPMDLADNRPVTGPERDRKLESESETATPAPQNDHDEQVPQTEPTSPSSSNDPDREVEPGPTKPSASDYDPLSTTDERTIKAGTSFKECASCPEMVALPSGSFTMGSRSSDFGHEPDERPAHRVRLSHKLAISRYPITMAKFDYFATVTGYEFTSGCRIYEAGEWVVKPALSFRNPGFKQSDNHPVVCINWHDARSYTNWLTARTKKLYRLPSEAEWEYAARAGTTTLFWWGDSIMPVQANYDWAIAFRGGRRDTMHYGTMSVRSFEPNPWGLYQVHGNVSEWVQDCWNHSYQQAPSDGSAWLAGDCTRRVLRGGSWGYAPKDLRVTYREGATQENRNFNFGFRVARTLDATSPRESGN